MHARLAALARGQAPLRRALVRLAARFVAMQGWERLGYVRLRDWAIERVGRSARTLQDLARMDAVFAGLPRLEAAFLGGEVSWAKARLVGRVACGEDESRWLELARRLRVRALEREVRAVDVGSLEAGAAGLGDGAGTDEEGSPIEAREGVVIACAPHVRAKWFRARQIARQAAGESLPIWGAMEAVAAEVASAIPTEPVDVEGGLDAQGPRPLGVAWVRYDAARLGAPDHPRADSWRARRRGASPSALERRPAANGCAEQGDPGSAMPDLPPEIAELLARVDELDAFELDARIRRAVALEQRFEACAGPLLREAVERRLHRDRGYATLEGYARDTLGVSPRKARALLRLERACAKAPALRAAYRDGALSWVKAQALVPLALLPGAALEGWVDWTHRITVRRLEEDVERALLAHELDPHRGVPPPPDAAAHDPQPEPAPEPDRKTGAQAKAFDAAAEAPEETARLFWSAPTPAARFFRAVLCSVRRWSSRKTGWLPTPGEAFEAMLDHALETWCASNARVRREQRVIARDGFRCSVPGCSSYRNLHDHHLRFRSAGGSDALANRTTLCTAHHLRGVHAGRVRITGEAPDRLRFELGLRPGAPPLEIYRSGDVREVPMQEGPPGRQEARRRA